MSLRRTVGGLASLHLFFRVDCIVYCEGGWPLNEADILAGRGDDGTLDVFFWKSISDLVGAKRNYHFKSVGSKVTLKSIAADVATNALTSVIVCLDRDYDWLCGRRLSYSNVLYTYGYSWESDVVCSLGLERLFFRLFPMTNESKQTVDEGLAHIQSIASDLVRWCEIEITLSSRDMALLFLRDKPMASIDLNGRALPALSATRLKVNLTQIGFRRRPRRVVAISEDEVFRHVWGKLAARLFYHLFIRLAARFDTGMRMTYELFMRLMISELMETMRQDADPEKRAYYETMAAVLT